MESPNFEGKAPAIASPARDAQNPFDKMFDGDDSEERWWNKDEMTRSDSSVEPADLRITKGFIMGDMGNSRGVEPVVSKVERKYSVQKPTRIKSRGRQRIQNAKAGIKLVTSFSRRRAPSPQAPKMQATMGAFVDLATLQGLDEEVQRFPRRFPSPHESSQPPSNEMSLSPSDQTIVIGVSVPPDGLPNNTLRPERAGTTLKPHRYEPARPSHRRNASDAPTIVITPARERARVTSSIYSQSTAPLAGIRGAPPMPRVPATYQKSSFSPDSDDDSMGEAEPISVFEDDSPVVLQTARAISIPGGSRKARTASISTAGTGRKSRGWWNYIVLPFLTRSNTNDSGLGRQMPEVPSLAIAATRAQEAIREGSQWDKHFSPSTPSTANSDEWWEAWEADTKQDPSSEPDIHNHPGLKVPFDSAGPETQEATSTERSSASAPQLPAIMHHPLLSDFQTPGATTKQPLRTRGEPMRADTIRSMAQTDISMNDREVPLRFDIGTLPTINDMNEPPTPPRSNNPFVQPRLPDINNNRRSNGSQASSRAANQAQQQRSSERTSRRSRRRTHDAPPPYTPSPARRIPKYRAIFPPGHPNGRRPTSPGPVSPSMQRAMSARGGIPMTEVGVGSPVSAFSSDHLAINLNSAYHDPPQDGSSQQFVGAGNFKELSKEAKKAESKRRRWEKEDAIARKMGGCWRGRGCISENGCYGRGGAEGRMRRRWGFCLIITVILLAAVLVPALLTVLHKKSESNHSQSQWVNLTSFPPMLTGFSTVAQPNNIKSDSGCVSPSTQWSCALPKELQNSTKSANQPNFLMNIQWNNSEEANATWVPNLGTRSLAGNAVSAGHLIRRLLLSQSTTFTPNPAPATEAEQFFLGNTTDNIAASNKSGEVTPFYISFGDPGSNASVSKRRLKTRQTSSNSEFPNITAFIPAPNQNADGSASQANLLPFPLQQPLKLYDRGLATEHFGFYTYFDRSIFLKSLTTTSSDDNNGGASESDAAFRCTWAQTRFLVQMWTRMNSTASLIGSPTTPSADSSASDFTQPGSFPYPVTITIDRHGGNPAVKMLYCYGMDGEKQVSSEGQINSEDRGFGGTLINAAPGLFSNASDSSLGGFDGGDGGCSCQWSNFDKSTQA